MNIKRKRFGFVLLILGICSLSLNSQGIKSLIVAEQKGLKTNKLLLADSSIVLLPESRPLFSFEADNNQYGSGDVSATYSDGHYSQIYANNINVKVFISAYNDTGFNEEILFENKGDDTISISNVIPFGKDPNSVYITGMGPWDLARAWLFRPGYRPVRVILPDNAWELGYSSFVTNSEMSVCALARRIKIDGGQRQRYETILPPKGKVTYSLHADLFKGDWQNGLRLIFRDRILYDLDKFDNSLFVREDLSWIKESYIIILQMAWDREFYDRLDGKYNYANILRSGIELFGNIDVFGIWPTWPRLGLDPRNQWDLYRDLPGGTNQLRTFARLSRQSGTRFFIAYNPWDNSTRKEDHYMGMARLISEIEADGVVLDTRGSSSYELQAAADSVRQGVVMYSEGMAIPKDMPGIIAGRVHNAIYFSPELNLNKLIKPDFSIFRVCDVGEDANHREIAIAFFNGYGTELNMFRPGGRDEFYRDDLNFLGHTTLILRQNNDAFLDQNWTPLIQTTIDSVYVNRWGSAGKTIYTVLNMRSDGYDGKLFKVNKSENKHWISLWNHENLSPVTEKGISYITTETEGWKDSYKGTRKEGSVDCIAEFSERLKTSIKGDSIKIGYPGKGQIFIWKGNPSYQTVHNEFRISKDTSVSIKDIFEYYEGKIVIQYLENKRLIDENILNLKGGKPWIISKLTHTRRASSVPSDMVLIPGADFVYKVTANDEFIPYPEMDKRRVKVDSFLIDKYPVTNAQYYNFITKSGYRPADTTRYLRHWEEGMYKQGQDKYPVVYLSYEDMLAYADWVEKRLPSEAEWQRAAQGNNNRKWPWGDEFHGTYCNNSFDRPTPVDAFSKGSSPYGVYDLVGNIWQMTGDMYFNGTNYFSVIRGGSYYNPESSWWYIKGGPQSLDKTQILLQLSPGFDRSPTVGFRCVKDIDTRGFKDKKQK